MVRPAGLPLRVLSHGAPLLSSRAVAAAVTITVLTVSANADLGPGLAVAAPGGSEEVPRTTPHVHSDWPIPVLQAVHFQLGMDLYLCMHWLPSSALPILCSCTRFIFYHAKLTKLRFEDWIIKNVKKATAKH